MREAQRLGIGKHFWQLASRKRCLSCLPPCRFEQIGVPLQEIRAHRIVGEQEGRELLGKNVVRPDRIPYFARHLVLARGGGGGVGGGERGVGDCLLCFCFCVS